MPIIVIYKKIGIFPKNLYHADIGAKIFVGGAAAFAILPAAAAFGVGVQYCRGGATIWLNGNT